MHNDPRITRVGRILRTTKIDELPQFFNVVRGDMSLVGPRPEDPEYVALYTPEQRRILDLKPGITSVAALEYVDEGELLKGDDWEAVYREQIVPAKLALEAEYAARRTLLDRHRAAVSHGLHARAPGLRRRMNVTFEEKFRVPMSAPDIDESDVEAVAAVVRSGRLALGPKCVEFERAIADYVGVRHAVAVSSGTAALHLLVRILGIGNGDEVLVPSFTFAASVNAILYEGATPVFVDIEPETYNLDPADLERRITPRTKAIMAVDVFGHPAPWDEIEAIASRHGLLVIDDCCEALGAEYKGRKLGQFGAGGAFAFYPNKQITTGEGGVIVTNDDEIARLAVSLRNQGRDGGTWLDHARLGFNYRLDDMSAAIGCTQMARIEEFLAKRAAVAGLYTERLDRRARRAHPGGASRGQDELVRLRGDARQRHRRGGCHRGHGEAGRTCPGVLQPHPHPALRARPVRPARGRPARHRGGGRSHHRAAVPQQPVGRRGRTGRASALEESIVEVRS